MCDRNVCNKVVCARVCVRERESVGGHEAQRGPPEPAQCRKCQACRAKVAVRDSVTLLCVCVTKACVTMLSERVVRGKVVWERVAGCCGWQCCM